MIGWSQNERAVLEDVVSGEHSRKAFAKFCATRAAYCREQCASLMESLPARADEARNYAARATVYAGLLEEIEDALGRE